MALNNFAHFAGLIDLTHPQYISLPPTAMNIPEVRAIADKYGWISWPNGMVDLQKLVTPQDLQRIHQLTKDII